MHWLLGHQEEVGWHGENTLKRSGVSSSALSGLDCDGAEVASGLAGLEVLKQARRKEAIPILVGRLAPTDTSQRVPSFSIISRPAHQL